MIEKIFKGRINTYGSLLKFTRNNANINNYKVFYNIPNFELRLDGSVPPVAILEFELVKTDCEGVQTRYDFNSFIEKLGDYIVFDKSENNLISGSDLSILANKITSNNMYSDSILQNIYLDSDISDVYHFEVLFGTTVEYYSDYFKIDKGLDNIIIFWEHNKKVCSSENKIAQNLILPSDSFINISAEITEDRTDKSLRGGDVRSNVDVTINAVIDMKIDLDDVSAILYMCNAHEKSLFIPHSQEWYNFENESWDLELEPIRKNEIKCNITISLSKCRIVGCSLESFD